MKFISKHALASNFLILAIMNLAAAADSGSPLLKCDRYDDYTKKIEASGVIVTQLVDGTLSVESHIVGWDNANLFWIVDINGSQSDGTQRSAMPNGDTTSFSIFNGYYAVDYENCSKI